MTDSPGLYGNEEPALHQQKSHERTYSGDGIWLSGRDLFHLESALGIVQGGAASQRLRVISEEARNVHLQRLALENAMLSAVLELESVLSIERPVGHSLSVKERFQEVWRAAGNALCAFMGLTSEGSKMPMNRSVHEAEGCVIRLAQRINDALREKSMIEDDFETFKKSHEQLRIMFRDLVDKNEVKLTAPPPFVSKRSAKRCLNCSERFGVFKTRRHCRNCGQVFCRDCSNNFSPLPHFGHEAPVRCCDVCFKKQSEKRQDEKVKETIPDIGLLGSPAPADVKSTLKVTQVPMSEPLNVSVPTVHRDLPSPHSNHRPSSPDEESRVETSVAPSSSTNMSLAERLIDARSRLRPMEVSEPQPSVPVGRVLDSRSQQLLQGRQKLRQRSGSRLSSYVTGSHVPDSASTATTLANSPQQTIFVPPSNSIDVPIEKVIPVLSEEEEERLEKFGGGELLLHLMLGKKVLRPVPFREPAPAAPIGRVLSPGEVSLNNPSPRVPSSQTPSVERRHDFAQRAQQSLDLAEEFPSFCKASPSYRRRRRSRSRSMGKRKGLRNAISTAGDMVAVPGRSRVGSCSARLKVPGSAQPARDAIANVGESTSRLSQSRSPRKAPSNPSRGSPIGEDLLGRFSLRESAIARRLGLDDSEQARPIDVLKNSMAKRRLMLSRRDTRTHMSLIDWSDDDTL